ncbi:hypothetical protein SAMN05216249_11425 [Acetitomaculum ruminis DSM 5522]|uniref:Uncharacterized protein n=1 Tax=Acetitomaculum ruminis DSM 5522 TaxID=1120918 RepID=A0A1I0ZB77_9FIRM|nr:hypothetical protein [Acetitomaculum ruminis]SFB22885.1 hypothetical protein SAMN05216249_11425 [Acetitomaculum ruminis DSM 5522]
MKLKVGIDPESPWKPVFSKDSIWEKASRYYDLKPHVDFHMFNSVTKHKSHGIDELKKILSSNDDIGNYLVTVSFDMYDSAVAGKIKKLIYIDKRGKMHSGLEILEYYNLGIYFDILGGDPFINELNSTAMKVLNKSKKFVNPDMVIDILERSIQEKITRKMIKKSAFVAKSTIRFIERLVSCKEIEVWSKAAHLEEHADAIIDFEENNEIYLFKDRVKTTYYFLNGYDKNKRKRTS